MSSGMLLQPPDSVISASATQTSSCETACEGSSLELVSTKFSFLQILCGYRQNNYYYTFKAVGNDGRENWIRFMKFWHIVKSIHMVIMITVMNLNTPPCSLLVFNK